MKFTIFTLADKEYGVNISQVREVIRMRQITPVPEASDFVEGVISLRGKVAPVISLRKKLGLEEKKLSETNRIIVTEINGHALGVIVDNVTDVISLEAGEITPPDEVLKKAKYLIGVGKAGKRLILVADMQKLLTGEDKTKIGKVEKRVLVRKKERA